MFIVLIKMDVYMGPIWYKPPEGGPELDLNEINVLRSDPILNALDKKVGQRYASYYEDNSHDMPFWFNYIQFRKDIPELLRWAGEINARLKELVNGTFEVVDELTPELLREQHLTDDINLR